MYRIGIDIGGTFTDIVLAGEDGSRANGKVLTTPDDFGRAIAEGLAQLLKRHAVQPGQIARIVHATTVATNAILEGKGWMDDALVEEEVVQAAVRLVERDPSIAALLLECSDMPPYAAAVQEATGLPVWDFTTLIGWIDAGVVRHRFQGFI